MGVDPTTANGVIRNLDEFGPAFFHLASVIPISAARFRPIAAAVSERGVNSNGELIQFHVALPGRLAKAVKDLCAHAAAEAQGADGAGRLKRAATALKNALEELESVSTLEMDVLQRQSLHLALEHAMEKLGRLGCIVPR